MSELIYDTAGEQLVSLIVWGFMIWLIILIMKIVSSVTPIAPSDMFAKIGSQFFKIILVIAILKTPAAIVFGYLIEPVLATTFALAAAISGAQCDGLRIPVTEGVFSPALSTALICLISSMQSVLGFIQGIGSNLICTSWGAGWFGLLPAWGPLIAGIILFICMIIIMITYALQLLDNMLRFAILCSLMPLLVAAWAFQVTKAFAQKGWELFISITVTFVCLALAVSMAFFMFDAVFSGGMAALRAAVEGDDVTFLAEAFEISGMSVVKVILVCIFSYAIISKAPAFGDHFAESPWRASEGIGSQLIEQMPDKFNPMSISRKAFKAFGFAGRATEKAAGGAIAASRVAGNRFRRHQQDQRARSSGEKTLAGGTGTKSLSAQDLKAGQMTAKQPQSSDVKTMAWETQSRDEKGRFMKTPPAADGTAAKKTTTAKEFEKKAAQRAARTSKQNLAQSAAATKDPQKSKYRRFKSWLEYRYHQSKRLDRMQAREKERQEYLRREHFELEQRRLAEEKARKKKEEEEEKEKKRKAQEGGNN